MPDLACTSGRRGSSAPATDAGTRCGTRGGTAGASPGRQPERVGSEGHATGPSASAGSRVHAGPWDRTTKSSKQMAQVTSPSLSEMSASVICTTGSALKYCGPCGNGYRQQGSGDMRRRHATPATGFGGHGTSACDASNRVRGFRPPYRSFPALSRPFPALSRPFPALSRPLYPSSLFSRAHSLLAHPTAFFSESFPARTFSMVAGATVTTGRG